MYECPITEIPIYLLLDSEAIIAINKFMRSLEAFNISLHVKGFANILVFKMQILVSQMYSIDLSFKQKLV